MTDCSLRAPSICRGPKMKTSVTPSGQEIDFIFISSTVRIVLMSILNYMGGLNSGDLISQLLNHRSHFRVCRHT